MEKGPSHGRNVSSHQWHQIVQGTKGAAGDACDPLSTAAVAHGQWQNGQPLRAFQADDVVLFISQVCSIWKAQKLQ